MQRERFVIAGASLAGGSAAAALREGGFDGEITLIGADSATRWADAVQVAPTASIPCRSASTAIISSRRAS